MQEVALDNSAMKIVNDAVNSYSKLIAWEVWNFMTLTHAKAEFDEKNIVSFKGYNDSGKSAMLRALDVLLFNIKPSAQVGFIQDDTDYFRIMAYFDDGITILRDKYMNGQSLYEMYKDGECIFTTKQNNKLVRISEVPQLIQDYLGVINCDGIVLNSRSCFEKQLLVQTTGSENYKFLNAVLKSEEIAIASTMLNTDKNKLLSDINTTESELNAFKSTISDSEGVSFEMITDMKRRDKILDDSDGMLSSLGTLVQNFQNISEIPQIPEIIAVDSSKVDLLVTLSNITNQLTLIPNLPEFQSIESSQLDILASVTQTLGSLNSIPSLPELSKLDLTQIDLLSGISQVVAQFITNENEITNATNRLDAMNIECQTLESQMAEFGHKFIRCKNCNSLIDLEESSMHSH